MSEKFYKLNYDVFCSIEFMLQFIQTRTCCKILQELFFSDIGRDSKGGLT